MEGVPREDELRRSASSLARAVGPEHKIATDRERSPHNRNTKKESGRALEVTTHGPFHSDTRMRIIFEFLESELSIYISFLFGFAVNIGTYYGYSLNSR
jgi:hypothetical protein